MATPYIDLPGACEKILRNMQDIAKGNYPFAMGRATGMLDALLDPSNGSINLVGAQGGKKFVKGRVAYKVRAKSCEILEDGAVPSVCNDGTEPLPLEVEVTLDKHISTPTLTFTNDNMVNICQDTQAFVNEYLLSYQKALRERLDEIMLAKADDKIGVTRHQDGSADTAIGGYKDKQLLATNSGVTTPLFANFSDIKLDYQYNQLSGIPRMVGNGTLQKFMELAGYSCCNASGVAYDSAIATTGAAFYVDDAASTILGANRFLVFAPNLLHLLSWNKNANIAINTELRRRIVIPDAVYPGLNWDLDFEFTCDDTWNFKLSGWFGLFSAIQADSFGDEDNTSPVCEDELVGFTGVMGYRATSA